MNKMICRVIFLLGFVANLYSQGVYPVLSNFRIENSNKDRVYFDVDGDITGLTEKGFKISGKTVTGVNILNNYYYYYNYWCWYYPYYCGWGWGYPSVSSYTTGTLLMTLIADGVDYITPSDVWTGALNGMLSGAYNTSRVTKGIDQAFEQSPYLKVN